MRSTCVHPRRDQDGQESKIWKLRKVMYGLKQSGRAWNQKLDSTLKQMSFQQSKADFCIYYKSEKGKMIIIAIYVDDIMIMANDVSTMTETKKSLTNKFKMKDLGEIKNFLGIRIERDRQRGKIWMDQNTYIQRILEKYHMDEANPADTPLNQHQALTKEIAPKTVEEAENVNSVSYQEMVGSILYASLRTRPDIAQAISLVSRFDQNPGKPHWIAVKRILRYLKTTKDLKLGYSRDGNASLEGFSDSNWANDQDQRHSISGTFFRLQGDAISWQSERQKTPALSTTEVEYMALSSASQEGLWLRHLLREIDPSTLQATKIFCDNKETTDLARDGGYRRRSKHIDIRHHFLRDQVEKGEITIRITTQRMMADALTKALPKAKFQECVKEIGLFLRWDL